MTGKVHSTAGIVFGVGSILLLNYVATETMLGFSVNPDFANFVQIKEGTEVIFDTGLTNCMAIFAGSFLGSLLPDIDHPTSTASKKMFIFSIPYRILQFIFGKFKSTKHFVGHRGITHSLLFMFIPLCLMFFVLSSPFWKAAMFGLTVGIFSHLFMDMLNPHGVPLFMPFAKKTFRLLPKKLCIRTK